MGDCLITNISFDESGAKPTSVKFQNGNLLEGTETELSCGLYIRNEENCDVNAIHPIIASEALIYAGKVDRSTNVYNTFIAIRNKKTNKMRLVAIDQAMLKPQVPKTREILDSTMTEVGKTAITDLQLEFGSKKAKRYTTQLEKYKVNIDNYKDQLEKTVANIEMDENDLVENVNPTSEYLPVINKDAKKCDDVYALKLPPQVIQSLDPHAENLLEVEEDQIGTNEYVKEAILSVRNSDVDNETKKERITLFLVIDGLINIFLTTARNIANKQYKPTKYSKELNHYILNNFTLNTDRARTRPLSMKDKATCYIIVLSLLTTKKYVVNLNNLSEVLKLGKKKLQDLCRMLLLQVKDSTATLALPLPEPLSNYRPKNIRKGRRN